MSKENMEKLLKDVRVMAREELERANHEFPPFASDHEGYAVKDTWRLVRIVARG